MLPAILAGARLAAPAVGGAIARSVPFEGAGVLSSQIARGAISGATQGAINAAADLLTPKPSEGEKPSA